jgi:ubiquinone biosynthesis protein UbiJ
MFEAMKALAERSVMERAVLLLNHVIAAEPQAMDRLRAHAGRTLRIELEGWPSLLPAPSPIALRITAPGLVEWLAFARFVVGERPELRVEGDAAFAADVDWLIENLRWDVEDDLARLVGDAPAREIGRFGQSVAKAIRDAARSLDGFARRDGRPPAR